MPASDDALSGRLSAALDAAGDIAYAWDLGTDRIDWFGRFARPPSSLPASWRPAAALSAASTPTIWCIVSSR
jgi:hypothetical protein